MSDKDRKRQAYPVDPNFSGAFAGGPPLLSEEEARRLTEEPEAVQREADERWQRMLREMLDAAQGVSSTPETPAESKGSRAPTSN